ncbi:hypothetical protein Aduo_004952 [Ancylostoma duodenale]
MRLLLLALLLAVCVGAGFISNLGAKMKGGVKGVKGALTKKDKKSEEMPTDPGKPKEKTSFGKKVIGIFTKNKKSDGKPKNGTSIGNKIKGVFSGGKRVFGKVKNKISEKFGETQTVLQSRYGGFSTAK